MMSNFNNDGSLKINQKAMLSYLLQSALYYPIKLVHTIIGNMNSFPNKKEMVNARLKYNLLDIFLTLITKGCRGNNEDFD